MNDLFEQEYRSDVLRSRLVQEANQRCEESWENVSVPREALSGEAVGLQTVEMLVGPLVIIDDSADRDLVQLVGQFQEQVSLLKRMCSTDILTGVWNRRHFERVVATELERSTRHRQPVSLVLLDIDHFKRINDTFGHQVGDTVLRELVTVVGAAIRPVDMLFRWGGEEFVVLAAGNGYRGAAALAERVRSAVAGHHFSDIGQVTVSIGVAEHLAQESAKIWFDRLDTAMYQCKTGGRNRVCVDRRGSSDLWAAERGNSFVRLVWEESYECGEPNIDEQHRELFRLANLAIDASIRAAKSPTQFEDSIDGLLAHIATHFAYEEAALDARAYYDVMRHKAAHAALLTQAAELKAAAANGGATIGEFVDFVADRVVARHLFTADRRFFPLFQDQGSQKGSAAVQEFPA